MTQWQNQPAIVIASGPSLTLDDIELVRESGINTVAVNSTWEKVRFCHAIYAADLHWWAANAHRIDIGAERWTCSHGAAVTYDGQYRRQPTKDGYNSGANAIEFVCHLGADPVLMLGFDCSVKHGVHHHGKHRFIKARNPGQEQCQQWRQEFKQLAKKLAGKRIVNCSRYSEIKAFPVVDLKHALNSNL